MYQVTFLFMLKFHRFNDLKEGQINVIKLLTEDTIFENLNISNHLMTFSEYYLAYRFAASS